jgi:hypothetical protein
VSSAPLAGRNLAPRRGGGPHLDGRHEAPLDQPAALDAEPIGHDVEALSDDAGGVRLSQRVGLSHEA